MASLFRYGGGTTIIGKQFGFRCQKTVQSAWQMENETTPLQKERTHEIQSTICASQQHLGLKILSILSHEFDIFPPPPRDLGQPPRCTAANAAFSSSRRFSDSEMLRSKELCRRSNSSIRLSMALKRTEKTSPQTTNKKGGKFFGTQYIDILEGGNLGEN